MSDEFEDPTRVMTGSGPEDEPAVAERTVETSSAQARLPEDPDEEPTRALSSTSPADGDFDAPTRVDAVPEGGPLERTVPTSAPAELAAVTLRRPLPEAREEFEPPTVIAAQAGEAAPPAAPPPEPAPAAAPPMAEPAPASGTRSEPAARVAPEPAAPPAPAEARAPAWSRSVARAALSLLGAAVTASALIWALVPLGDAPEPEQPTAFGEPADAPAVTTSPAPTAAPPLSEPPALDEAVDLVVNGRFAEAARAYEALARAHPHRREYATLARILRAKARP